MATISATDLAQLLVETGKKHHEAFISSDGADPEWAKWYAPYIQAKVWDGFGAVPTRSELVYLLIGAEKAHREDGGDEPWPEFYAGFILDGLT